MPSTILATSGDTVAGTEGMQAKVDKSQVVPCSQQ